MTWKMVGKWFCGDFLCEKRKKSGENIYFFLCDLKTKTIQKLSFKSSCLNSGFFKDNLFYFLDFSSIDNIRKKNSKEKKRLMFETEQKKSKKNFLYEKKKKNRNKVVEKYSGGSFFFQKTFFFEEK